ncbi:hypothetical protein SADUNF_Sadunf16G0280300 [Salix dunnii]|uniref:ABC transporter domain-containing protein n=1 Tax=Salix dunnii TaxID=1413687 RepID=A0A835MK93_9ROSI|nr:hypothetical protein SADUNF_Sadunf16G0280300 [Salix dunnii]
MKDGSDTYYRERGIQQLGGQNQRLALAHAILKDLSILLLEEKKATLLQNHKSAAPFFIEAESLWETI